MPGEQVTIAMSKDVVRASAALMSGLPSDLSGLIVVIGSGNGVKRRGRVGAPQDDPGQRVTLWSARVFLRSSGDDVQRGLKPVDFVVH